MNKNLGQEPPNRNLAAGLGILTSVVLLGAAGVLAMDLVSGIGAEPSPAAAPIVPAITGAAASAPMPGLTILAKTILTVTAIVAMSIIAPLVGALCLFGLLRRYGKHLGPLIHLEYTGPPPTVVGPFGGSPFGFGGAAASSAQPLNLGPSFEEDRLRHVALAGHMEAGVLRQLFDDNVKLQEKIGIARANEKTAVAEVDGAGDLSSV
jgi:hypothetical protein